MDKSREQKESKLIKIVNQSSQLMSGALSVPTFTASDQIVANAHAVHHFIDLVWLQMIGRTVQRGIHRGIHRGIQRGIQCGAHCGAHWGVRQTVTGAIGSKQIGRYGRLWSWTRNQVAIRMAVRRDRLTWYLHVLEVAVLQCTGRVRTSQRTPVEQLAGQTDRLRTGAFEFERLRGELRKLKKVWFLIC